MTSANVTHYTVTEIATRKEFTHRQHCLCKNKLPEFLAQFTDPMAYHIDVNHPDENEDDDILFEGNLAAYLSRKTDEPLCPCCLRPLCKVVTKVVFASGTLPVHLFSPTLEAVWCPNGECYNEQVNIRCPQEETGFEPRVISSPAGR